MTYKFFPMLKKDKNKLSDDHVPLFYFSGTETKLLWLLIKIGKKLIQQTLSLLFYPLFGIAEYSIKGGN